MKVQAKSRSSTLFNIQEKRELHQELSELRSEQLRSEAGNAHLLKNRSGTETITLHRGSALDNSMSKMILVLTMVG